MVGRSHDPSVVAYVAFAIGLLWFWRRATCFDLIR
jgi:hypothetical protein